MPVLQKRYSYLWRLPIHPFDKIYPQLLIGADNTFLITAKEPVRLGLRGGPAALKTELGWALQDPDGPSQGSNAGLLLHHCPITP